MGAIKSSSSASVPGGPIAYNFATIKKRMKQNLGSICQAHIYESPIKKIWNISQFPKHEQLVFSYNEGKEFMLISFSDGGIECYNDANLAKLINRKKNNQLKQCIPIRGNVTLSEIANIIEKVEEKGYSVTGWNCRDFVKYLTDKIRKM